MFKGRIAHGMLTAGFISAVLGTKLPGPGSIYLSQTLKFKAPVRIGDTVRGPGHRHRARQGEGPLHLRDHRPCRRYSGDRGRGADPGAQAPRGLTDAAACSEIMRLFRHPNEVTPECRGAAIALGNFDGVHLGHQAVIARAFELGAGL